MSHTTAEQSPATTDPAQGRAERYPDISSYALIGDCHSAGLVGRSGSIDWLCLRRFDAGSTFGRLLDWDHGGFFSIRPSDPEATSERRYRDGSLVLDTTFTAGGGRVRVTDCFAMRLGGQQRPHHELIRVVEGVEGEVDVDVVIEPRFDYGSLRPWLRLHDSGSYSAVGGDTAIVICTPGPVDFDDRQQDRLWTTLTLRAGERLAFSVESQAPHRLNPERVDQEVLLQRLEDTVEWWNRWSAGTRVEGRYAQEMSRSAIVLKALTCAPTGAIVAAATTSLPEQIGGERNWDYRYSWVRDSVFVLAALHNVGHDEVAQGFRDFIMRSAAGSAADLQIMYGVYGERRLPEIELDLEGWRGSRPVRAGNGAAAQAQHDVYGQIISASYLWRRVAGRMPEHEWSFLRSLANEASRVWDTPDRGMWEVRGAPQHFVTSKVMLWVALHDAAELGREHGCEAADVERWEATADRLREEIDRRGVHPDEGYFVQSYGSTDVDAGLLLLPMVGYCAADDPRMVATVDAIRRDLTVHRDGFILRYRTESYGDGLRGHEGTFLMCSFWLVEVLAMQGRREEATELLDRLVAVANDVGLYAEEYDPLGRQLLGNFPQAFTHMALINAAHQLSTSGTQVPGTGRLA